MAEPKEIVTFNVKELFHDLMDSEYERRSMINFIRENTKNMNDRGKEIPKYIRKRYGIYPDRMSPGLAWYLLDQYFKGNIIIKEDAQSES